LHQAAGSGPKRLVGSSVKIIVGSFREIWTTQSFADGGRYGGTGRPWRERGPVSGGGESGPGVLSGLLGLWH